MTITKILQVCYLTHTDTTKLVEHWENYSWVCGSYQLPVITIKRTKKPKFFSKFLAASVVAQEKSLPMDFRKNGSWNVLVATNKYL